MEILEALIEKIENRRDNLISEEIEVDQERIDYLNAFFDKCSGKRVASFAHVKAEELLMAMLLEENRNLSFEVLHEEIEKSKNLFNAINESVLYVLYNVSKCLSDDLISLKEELTKCSTEKSLAKRFITEKKLRSKLLKLLKENDLEEMVADWPSLTEIINALVVLSKVNNTRYLDLLALVINLRPKQIISEMIDFEMSNYDGDSLLELELKETIDQKVLEKFMDPLYKYYLELEKDQNDKEKSKNRKLIQYANLLTELKRKNNKKEITDIDKVLDLIQEEELKNMYLRYVYEYNKSYYDELEAEYNYKNENSISKYIMYFKEMGIDFNSLSQSLKQQIMNEPLNIIKEKVKLLSSIFIETNDLINILVKTNMQIIEEIDSYIRKGYIKKTTILENSSMYYDSIKFENLKANISILLSEKVNIINIDDKEVLFTDNSILARNIEILKSSNIKLSSLKSIEMLKDETLQEKIDSLVEIGLEEIVKKKPEILDSDINLAKRIVIARMIGVEIIENDTIKESILDKDKFFVADNIINTYLFDRDNSNYINKNMIILEGSEETPLAYNVEGIIIPKARVSNLKISLETLIRPSLYSKEEVKILEKNQRVEK